MKMKISLIPLILAVLLQACGRSSNKVDDSDNEKIRNEIISIAENYVMDQLQNKNKTSDANGIIIIGNEQKKFIIDPSRIITGLIDADKSVDAIIPVFPFEGQYEVMTHHLIITEKDGRYILERALESDMRVLGIKDGIITADVPEHSRNNPLFNCSSCWEVVKYRFVNGDLVRSE